MKPLQSSFVRTAGAIFASGAAAASLTLLAVAPPGNAHTSHPAAPAGTKAATSETGHVAAGKVVDAATSSKPFVPTKAQLAQRNRMMAIETALPAAPVGQHTTAASVPNIPGAPTVAPSLTAGPTSFDVLKQSTIPASCTSSCAQSAINEPDTASSGKDILQTSNWDIADSTNGGTTWAYQNPYTLVSNFCCDQDVLYQPNRDRFIYEGLFLGSTPGFVIALTPSSSLSSWCRYTFTPSNFGGTNGDVLDFPKISYSNNDLYLTWNEYDPSGNTWLHTGLARLPLDPMAACGTVGYNYIARTDNFTFGLTGPTSSLDTFYWVSNWYTSGGGSGTSERIYSWAENSGTYFYNDISVNSYNFAGGSCASQDGVVINWCNRIDPRYETPWITRAESLTTTLPTAAAAGDTILGVAITAGPGGSDPFPYVIYEYFKLDGMTYQGTAATFNDGYAFAYAGCGVDEQGYVGCIESWGGGTGSTHYYPGTFLLLQDNVSPTQPWGYDFVTSGAGNASAWGDYMVARPYQPEVGAYIGTGWIVNSSGHVVPTVYVWGRGDDGKGYSHVK